MHFKIYYLKSIYILSFFILLLGCQLKEPQQNHGILFLENRSEKLDVKSSNKNDVIKVIGQPHSKSIDNENEWIYIERILTKGEYHKLGRTVLKTNNVLVLNFEYFHKILYSLLVDSLIAKGTYLLVKFF